MFLPFIRIKVDIDKEEFLRMLRNEEIKCPITGKTLHEVKHKTQKMTLIKMEPLEYSSKAINYLSFFNSS